MIDYEKLKIAHELAVKYNPDCLVSVTFYSNCFTRFDYRVELHGCTEYFTGDIDKLLIKLKELTQPEKPTPKYEVGQEVWVIDGENPIACSINDVRYKELDGFLYSDKDGFQWLESDLYPTRESLIEAQIEYWNRLKDHPADKLEKVECQHESDELDHYIILAGSFIDERRT